MATSKFASTLCKPVHLWLVPLGVAIGLLSCVAARAAEEARLKSYGQHLAQECTSCHRPDGVNNGIPSIAGWPADILERTLRFYQQGARTNPVMVSVAKSLDDEQVRALALYWSSLPRVLPKAPPKAKK
jgi:cytochrome c553